MPDPTQALDQLLHDHLRAFLPGADDAMLTQLRQQMVWHPVAAGQVLMQQGEPGDAMYVLVSGRLRVLIDDHDSGGGPPRVVREMTRGQVVGEMSLYTDAPRSATVLAVRDSLLARLGKAEFDRLVQAHSAVSMALTRQVIRLLQSEGRGARPDRPVVIGLLAISEGLDGAPLAEMAERLAAELRPLGSVAVVDAAGLEARLGAPGLTSRPADDAEALGRIAVELDRLEAAHDFVLLQADGRHRPWARCCARHCDELLLLADADASPAPGAVERDCLAPASGPLAAPAAPATPATVLLLLHPATRALPSGTAAWLAPRRLAAHVHLRRGHEGDVARLGRLVSRTGVGLVLSGGGARGAAHAGVYRALQERGVPVDAVGGTSMGAVLGALMAFDSRAADVIDTFAGHFAANPTGDLNPLPLLSLIKGRRLRRMMEHTEQRFGGRPGVAIEDLWKHYFCVATNYSQASELQLEQGPLVDSVMASCAIPGALPPVLRDGDLLCDGGAFNNFPVDVMRGHWGIARVIGVDLDFDRPRRIELDTLPGGWALLRDRLRPPRQRRYRLPSLTNYLMNISSLVGTARQRAARELTDLYIRPTLPKVGMLQWNRYVATVKAGYDEAMAVLDDDARKG